VFVNDLDNNPCPRNTKLCRMRQWLMLKHKLSFFSVLTQMWQATWWLQEHCDYSFQTLCENMPKALVSVSVELIRKWEHCA